MELQSVEMSLQITQKARRYLASSQIPRRPFLIAGQERLSVISFQSSVETARP